MLVLFVAAWLYVCLVFFIVYVLFASLIFFFLGHLYARVLWGPEELIHFLTSVRDSLHVCPVAAHSEHIL